MLLNNNYEIEEKLISGSVLEEFQNKFNKTLKTIPQVVINDELIGGFEDVEDKIKGIRSINKV